jgi:hypothetical protein
MVCHLDCGHRFVNQTVYSGRLNSTLHPHSSESARAVPQGSPDGPNSLV